jgi:hypothetical protein
VNRVHRPEVRHRPTRIFGYLMCDKTKGLVGCRMPTNGISPGNCPSAASGTTRRLKARVAMNPMVGVVMVASSIHGCVGGILRVMCWGRKANFAN